MKRGMKESERTELLVVWTEEREIKKEGKEKLTLSQSICQLLFFIELKVKTELTTDFLYLPYNFSPPQAGLKAP